MKIIYIIFYILLPTEIHRGSMKEEKPRVIRRKYGGMMAISPAESRLQIGVIADTEDQAISLYFKALKEWRANLLSI